MFCVHPVRKLTLVAGASALALALSSCITFGPPVEHQANAIDGSSVVDLLYADVTGDGTDDLLVLTSQARLVRMEPCGVACIEPAESVAVAGALASADFDGDGIEDVVVAFGATARVFFGSDGFDRAPGISATDVSTITGLSQSGPVIAGDLTADGHADIGFLGPAFPNSYPITRYRVVPGDGAGGFGTVSTIAGDHNDQFMSDLALGDVDGDGQLEGIVASSTLRFDRHGAVSGITGTGVTAFAASGVAVLHWNDPIAEDGAGALAVGDIDGDGRTDAAVAVGGGAIPVPPGRTAVVVLRSTPSGFTSFQGSNAPMRLTPWNGVVDLALRDLNVDGRADLLATGSFTVGDEGHLSIWRGSTAGMDTDARKDLGLPRTVAKIALGAVGDPRPELALSRQATTSTTHAPFYLLPNVSDG